MTPHHMQYNLSDLDWGASLLYASLAIPLLQNDSDISYTGTHSGEVLASSVSHLPLAFLHHSSPQLPM